MAYKLVYTCIMQSRKDVDVRKVKFMVYAALAYVAILLVTGGFLWVMLFPEDGTRALTIAGFALIMGAGSNAMVESLRGTFK